MNKTTITGNLTRDPIVNVRTIGDQQVKVANFTVAVNEGYGEHRKTSYFRINAWRGLADTVEQYLTKGRKVLVEGPVSARNYIGSDGKMYLSLEIRADVVEFLSPNPNRADEPGEVPEDAVPADVEDVGPDGLPF